MKTRAKKSTSIIAVITIALVVIILALASGSGTVINSTQLSPTSGISLPSQGTIDEFFPASVEGVLSAKQQESYNRLTKEASGKPWVRVENGSIRYSILQILIPDNVAMGAAEKAIYFLDRYKDLFNLDPSPENLQVVQENQNSDGSTTVKFTQMINGISVYGSSIVINIDKNNEITTINGGYSPGNIAISTPLISADKAEEIVASNYSIDAANIAHQTSLMYIDERIFGDSTLGPILTWKVVIVDESGVVRGVIFIDSSSGEIVMNISPDINYRTEVYDNKQKPYPDFSDATKVMEEPNGCLSGQTCDLDAQNAFSFANEYEDFLSTKFANQGYLAGTELVKAYTHISIKPNPLCLDFSGGGDNAFWDNETQTISFTDQMSKNDIVFHELTHRLISINITSNGCQGFCYRGQSGALSESFSDVFAVLIDNGETGSTWQSEDWVVSDWTIGEDSPIGARDISGGLAERNNPNYHMRYYRDAKIKICANDYGFVHQNSVIPSKAAHLLLQNGTVTYEDITVTGIGPKKVAQIYYRAIDKYLDVNDDFVDARNSLVISCFDLIGTESISKDDCSQLVNAFAAVGIGRSVNINPTVTPIVSNTTTSIPPIPPSGTSSTVLILDTSGSMNEFDVSQKTKIQAAIDASIGILNVIEAEVQSGNASGSQVGLVHFNADSSIDLPLTMDIANAQNLVQGLTANNGTGMASGLQNGISLFSGSSGTEKSIIVLLSDGNPNIPLNGAYLYSDLPSIQQEVIDLASQAGQQGICVYTIGLGVPNTQSTMTQGVPSIDEDFLRRVASASGCGEYYNAQSSIQLANVFIGIRHVSMGTELFAQQGQISQGQQIDLGNVDVPENQELMLFTLNWPGSKLEAILKDPAGTVVDQNYPGTTLSVTSSLVSVIINRPMAGAWNLGVLGVDVPEGTTVYNAILSARQGVALPTPLPIETPTPAATGSGGGFSFVLLALVLVGGGLGVYVYSNSLKRGGKKNGPNPVQGASLLGIRGTFSGRTIPLQSEMQIGRGSQCNIHLLDANISRLHAVIRYTQGGWKIQDQGSATGTYLNGQRVNSAHLRAGDQVQIGANVFIFREG